SGRVAQLNLSTPLAPVSVPATKLRAAIGLRSTWFSVAVLSLAAPAPNPPVTYGSSVTLDASVRGVGGVTLEQRPNGGEWQPIGPVSGSAARLTESPTATTDYRLSTTSAAAGSVKIRVAPAITVSTFSSVEVSGSAKPLIMGAPVAVQQQNADGT